VRKEDGRGQLLKFDQDWNAIVILKNRRHIRMKRGSNSFDQYTCAILGAKYEMNVQKGERLGHGFESPFQGLAPFPFVSGALPRPILNRPFRAGTYLGQYFGPR
jgi:hypothetical protein